MLIEVHAVYMIFGIGKVKDNKKLSFLVTSTWPLEARCLTFTLDNVNFVKWFIQGDICHHAALVIENLILLSLTQVM